VSATQASTSSSLNETRSYTFALSIFALSHNRYSATGARIRDVLKYLFPVPKEDATRVMSFINDNDFISFRRVPFMC